MAAKPDISHIAVVLDSCDDQKVALNIATELAKNLRARLSGLLIQDHILLQAMELPQTQYVSSALAAVINVDRGTLEAHLSAVTDRLRRLVEASAKAHAMDFSFQIAFDHTTLPPDVDLLVIQTSSSNIGQVRRQLSQLMADPSQTDRALLLVRGHSPRTRVVVHVKSLSDSVHRTITWASRLAKGLRRSLWLVIEDPSLTPTSVQDWFTKISRESLNEINLSGSGINVIQTGGIFDILHGDDLLVVDASMLSEQEFELSFLLTHSTSSLLLIR